MVVEDVALDVSPFISFAKEQMGGVLTPGKLAHAFIAEAGKDSTNNEYPNFWQVGCVFDTILDYFLALKEADALDAGDRALMELLMATAVNGYRYGIVGLAAAWYDDWAWWGIAAAKSFDPDYADIFGAQLSFFQTAAVNLWGLVDGGNFATIANSIPDAIWARSAVQEDQVKFSKAILSQRALLHAGTRNAWTLIEHGRNGQGTPRQNTDYATFTTQQELKWAVPRFPGGCWQYDLSTMAFPCNDGPDWGNPDPAYNTLGVFQVTLMSGLYLSFCCSLIAASERKAAEKLAGGAWDLLQPAKSYQQSADEVVGFLTDWLGVESSDSLAAVFDAGVLVHERTPTYALLDDGTRIQLEGYFSDAFWGGDQGLIMGALKQYGELSGVVSEENRGAIGVPIYQVYPGLLLTGVFHNMSTSELPGAVGPYLDPSGNSPLSGDSNDYGSGSGIFWRYVMRCCRTDPGFKAKAKSDPTVVAVAKTSGMHPNKWGNDLFQPFNSVAAGVGAWYLLK